ncbi:MAG: hypothetical protein UX27_C0029G0003 [Candidatus Azambacteria bacterium GW2011_GWA2_45_90]|uniref:DUF502 domain-containing protein n=1 Tax=Candidatus Azambacteria bacterium GW2011_GWA2_45_90 TaxID=1618614 RepID=A0A0G1NAU7_9BACT|nr:MAG: hypothetical protein UX27_C0029G0003 [Candidatus Azambacteria bacterium GW2011_GWA2_45_90]
MAGNRIKTAFKRGFLFLLIPGLLIYIFGITVSIFDSFWSPFFFLIFGKNLFWGAGLLVSLALTLIIGWILTSRLFQGRLITNLTGRLWSKIPLLNLFFGKDFFSKEDLEKTKAALVEYPSPGWFQIGFIAGKQKIGDEDLYKIFMPTAPLPATGMFGFTKIIGGNKIIPLKNPPLEVIKLIVSCGFVDIGALKKEDDA